jgi:hypothetical protein
VQTVADLAKAVAAYLGINESDIQTTAPDYSTGTFPGRYIYTEGKYTCYSGFSDEDYDKLNVFRATSGWEKWAAAHNVTQENKYVKARMSYNNGYEMIKLVKVPNSSQAWNYTSEFSTLAALKAAAASLVGERNWDWQTNPPADLGPNLMRFTR